MEHEPPFGSRLLSSPLRLPHRLAGSPQRTWKRKGCNDCGDACWKVVERPERAAAARARSSRHPGSMCGAVGLLPGLPRAPPLLADSLATSSSVQCVCVCVCGSWGCRWPRPCDVYRRWVVGEGNVRVAAAEVPGKPHAPAWTELRDSVLVPPRDGVQTCVPKSVLKPTVVAVGGKAEGLGWCLGVQRWAHGGLGWRGRLGRPALHCLGAARQDGTRGRRAGTPCSGRGAASVCLWRMPTVNQGARPDLGRRLEADPQVRAGGHRALRAAHAPLCTAPSDPPALLRVKGAARGAQRLPGGLGTLQDWRHALPRNSFGGHRASGSTPTRSILLAAISRPTSLSSWGEPT